DAEHVGAWQLELRKLNDDPLEVDELVLHIQKTGDVRDDKLIRELNTRFVTQTEIHPNRILFHDADEMRELQGVGVQLKEQKIVDRRKTSGADRAPQPPAAEASGRASESLEVAV